MMITRMIVGCLFILTLGSPLAMAAENATPEPTKEIPKEEKPDGKVAKPLIGVEGGFNVASLKGSDASAVFDSRLGFVGGAFVNFHLGRTLAFQPEFLYSQKGGKINGTGYQLDYVEFPILLNLTFGTPAFNPGILVGPTFNTNVGVSQGAVNVNKKDVGLILGGQLCLSKIIASIRYEVGLTDVNTDADIKNGTFTFLLGLSVI